MATRHRRSNRWALVVVDMQNAFLDAGGSFGRLGNDMASLRRGVHPAQRALAVAREFADAIVHVRMAFRPNYSDVGLIADLVPDLLTVGGLKDGTWDAEHAPGFVPLAGEHEVLKNRYSGFYGTELDRFLASREIRSVAVCGVLTNTCVEATARDAMQRDIAVEILSDACGALDDPSHAQALHDMSRAVGRVVTVEEFVRGAAQR